MPIPRRRRRNMSMDMTPMIDCVFQLLIFFLLSSSLITPNVRLTLPQGGTRDNSDAPEIVLSVNQEGSFFLNNEPVLAPELALRLKPMVQQSKHKIVTFRGDQKMHYELFIKALDAARNSGAAHLNIAHQSRSGS